MDKHTVTMHTVTMHISDKPEPVNSLRYDADGGAGPGLLILNSLYLMKNAIVGNLVKDFESATAGKAPQRIRVTMIIETLDD